MVEIRYADLVQAPSRLTVTSMGAGQGPPGGGGWELVHVLPTTNMQAGAREYAFVITGKIGNRQTSGSGIARGMFQVCLGTTAGARFSHHLVNHTAALPLGETDGIPFMFLVLCTASGPAGDQVLGTSFNPATTELCIWARTFVNNDLQTYAAQFDICDLKWLWWDLSAIPVGHWLPWTVSAGSLLPASSGAFSAVSADFGAVGEQWLHFQNVWYEPRVHNQPSTQWEMGYSTDGTIGAFVPRIGSAGWGMSRAPSVGGLSQFGQIQQGGFWVHTHTNSTTRAVVRGWSPSPGQTMFWRYNHLAIRIDPLPDVRVRTEGGPLLVGAPAASPAILDTAVTVERPAAGILTDPIVLVHGVMREAPGTFGGHGARVYENTISGPGFGESVAPQVEASRGEGASSIAIGRRVFQVESPAIQWKVGFAGSDGAPATPQTLRDFQFVAFHPVRDPENITTPPGGLPAPIVLVPGRQAPAVGSLPVPPSQPSSARPQRGRHDRPSIRGGTGYRRSWPLGARPLAELSLQWGPMPRAEGQAVFDFLRANLSWRYTAPRAAAVAVMSTTPPQMVAVDHRNVTVSVDVAVLTFTGP